MRTSASELDAATVVQYLQQHPDFFNQQLDLLATLSIPHPVSGNAVSLVAKQLELFRNRQQKLESQLAQMLEIAHENHCSANKIQQLTLVLLNSPSFATALANLHWTLKEIFLTDFVALKIIQENTLPAFSEVFIAAHQKECEHLYQELGRKKPRCGRLNLAQSRFFFADVAAQVQSCAIIPLILKDFNGVLVIASRDEQRFQSSMGTLFLTQIGQIVSSRLAALLPEQSLP
jgi:hypothetical protein